MRQTPRIRLFAAVVLLCAAAQAASRPGVGDKAPDFSLPSLGGGEVRLSGITGGGPVVLLVLRGYPGYQCPICNRQVRDFLANSKGSLDARARVIMVYPGPDEDLPARAREFTSDKQFPEHFRLLLDPGYKFTNLYGLRWDAPRETAYPATFLIGRDGVIFFAKISDSHGGRTTSGEVIAELKQAKSAK